MNQEAAKPNGGTTPPNGPEIKSPKLRRPWVFILGTLILAAGLYWATGWVLDSFTHETTDDAFLDANVVTIAPKVAGHIARLLVTDNQVVKKGDLVIEIDPRDFEMNVAQRTTAAATSAANYTTFKANFDLARMKVVTAEASAKQAEAQVVAAEAAATKAQSDLRRNDELRRQNVISAAEFETFKTAAEAAQANLRAARENAAGEESKVNEARAQLEAARTGMQTAEAQVKQAEADVKAAELNLSYTKIFAPVDGRITHRQVERGDYVQIGQALFAIVPHELWVTANFKETQLTHIRVNQPVDIAIDSVSDRTFRGHVESMQSGSGARFSLLPPENAVGNFVKVVQRVPVKIVFDESINVPHVIGPGMSVVPSVEVQRLDIPAVVRVLVALVIALGIAWLVWTVTRPKPTD